MSTASMTYRHHNPLPWLILAIIALVAVAWPAVVERAHALAHDEAAAIRACYDMGGTFERWTRVDLQSGLQRDHCLVQLPDGRIADRVLQFCKAFGWLEVTAFVPADGVAGNVRRYLERHLCERVYP